MAKAYPAVYAPDLAMSYYNFGLIYGEMDKLKKAKQCFGKALEIYERLNCRNNGLYDEVIANCKEILEMLQSE